MAGETLTVDNRLNTMELALNNKAMTTDDGST
jgi:hypothetical protein